METLSGRIEVFQNGYCWYYEEIFKTFSGIISMRLGKNYKGESIYFPFSVLKNGNTRSVETTW